MSDTILGMSNEEIVEAARSMGITDSAIRVVGVYVEVGADLLSTGFFSAGVERVRFVGVDLDTGERVVANYGGLTLGVGASIIPGTTIGGGAFGFTGNPSALGGWSAGAQMSAGVTAGVSVNLDGSGVLSFAGANLSVGMNVAAGYTYRVRVGGELIFNFGTVDPDIVFDSLSVAHQFILGEDNRNPNGDLIEDYFTYEEAIGGTGYTLVQGVFVSDSKRSYETLVVTSTVVDEFGDPVSGEDARAILEEHGSVRTQDILNDFGEGSVARTLYRRYDHDDYFGRMEKCFGGEVLIDMWPLDPVLKPGLDGIFDQDEVRAKVWQKPIELIEVGDIVVSFDDNDNLVPGPVTRTFKNEVKILLNFHGTRVTPGHVYYRADSKRSHQYEALIDILRDDGVIKRQDGTLIRAATNVPVGSARDGFVKAVTQSRKSDGTIIQSDVGRIRLGTRFLVDTGKERKSWAVADLIEAGGGVVGEDELIRVGDGEPMAFLWDCGDTLPKPEDFVLACSGTTLEAIYQAAEWESLGSRLTAPVALDGGPVQPLEGAPIAPFRKTRGYRAPWNHSQALETYLSTCTEPCTNGCPVDHQSGERSCSHRYPHDDFIETNLTRIGCASAHPAEPGQETCHAHTSQPL